MEWIEFLIDFIIHIDEHLVAIVAEYGAWTYGILFVIVFAETGFVVTPFLPGDSLLFAAGAIAATGVLNPWFLFLLLFVAAVMGDSINYALGQYFGVRVFKENSKIFKLDYLRKTEHFFEKYGGKTIVLARFVPIVRTYAPFVAGASSMNYARFIFYNVFGGAIWVGLFVLVGYLFGNIPIVKNNFSLTVLGIIALSLVPIFVEFFRGRRRKKLNYKKSKD
ncbi:MAG TPA: DedA family protein [Flavobacteriaceae bacterium]|nr:DedA family protein [Flavobacteriaceae bacterium]